MTFTREPVDFTGFVLAGGRSSRMGSDKALLPYRESNFLHHAMETLSAACRRPAKAVVSENKYSIYSQMLSEDAVVADEFADRGALGGIHAALTNCETEFALILAVDLPNITADTAQRMISLAVDRDDIDALVAEQDDGRLQPLFGIYRAVECLAKIEGLFAKQDDCSVRDLLARIRTATVSRHEISDDPAIFLNVNDPASYDSIK